MIGVALALAEAEEMREDLLHGCLVGLDVVERQQLAALVLAGGSPTRVVPPPISTSGLPPVFCSQRSSMICTSEPTCSEGAVQSKPM